MILGLNTDVRHRGKTFHIQTEDSGPSNPVLITHLFIGGSIIASQKSGYADLLIDGEVDEGPVRERMRAQHKQMYEALMAGEHDAAARRPRGRDSRFKDIPLARKPKHTGEIVPSRPPAEIAPGVTAKAEPMPVDVEDPSDDEPSDEVSLLDSVDLIPLEEAADGPRRLEFPTALGAGAPFDALLITHLLDEAD